ncbi:DUF421 domain-containing protein [Sandaracinomonas limnophila]|uniref:DUF421 domain-containing protein n=1 Tax=Sandaracinomonas limnophila TaxID=1862386 RepID=A0A437PW41_9BACT|nr:YetF domain-containing protein [Sandaracinomonas limnophila]RVU26463.1 DUF421 domain-containing protein [Sandaracinomonas limnophila]
MEGYFNIALRSIAVYIFIVAAIRLFGKKEFAQLTITDLVFILLISNSVQNAMVGEDSSLLGGLASALGLFLLNFLIKKLTFLFPKVDKLLDGEPVTLVYQGKIIDSGLRKAEVSKEELMVAIREHGVEKLEEVDLAVFEVDGNISVLSENFRKSTKRRRKGHKILGKNQS